MYNAVKTFTLKRETTADGRCKITVYNEDSDEVVDTFIAQTNTGAECKLEEAGYRRVHGRLV